MSPVILPVVRSEPSQDLRLLDRGGGMIWAIGSPFRVTRIGLPVRLTFLSKAKQVALNFEIGTSSLTRISYSDHRQ